MGFWIDRPVLRCHITRPPGTFIADEAAGGQVKGETWEVFLSIVLLKCFGIFCYWCYYPDMVKDSVSPVRGIFQVVSFLSGDRVLARAALKTHLKISIN